MWNDQDNEIRRMEDFSKVRCSIENVSSPFSNHFEETLVQDFSPVDDQLP